MNGRRRAIVIGGGFYGAAIAIHLGQRGAPVTLVEKQPKLLTLASFANQARLHNGYHYPRSFRTAMRSHANLPLFQELYGAAVDSRFRALYAVARGGSKVSARHFQRFCAAAQIPLRAAKRPDRLLFEPRLIEEVYEVDEPAFNADILRAEMARLLDESGVDVRVNATAVSIQPLPKGLELAVGLESGEVLSGEWVFNCTYAALNHVDGRPNIRRPTLRHQIAEVVLIEPPPELRERGITLMDGPFFSTMPFPPRGLHSLTHVRYTHHATWHEGGAEPSPSDRNPLALLQAYLGPEGVRSRSRAAWMIRDASRFVPALSAARHIDSLFEIKTLVAETEIDDARPIYFERDREMPGLISILGSKIDNIFDILRYIDEAVAEAPA